MVSPAGFVARPGAWSGAGQLTGEASAALARVTARLCGGLAEGWGAWGKDDIGEAFCNGADGKPGFGKAADNLLTSCAQMVNLLAQAGWSLQMSGAQYAATEAANTVGRTAPKPRLPPKPATWRLPATARGLTPSDPPPIEWLSLLVVLEKIVDGCQYPDGNFRALASMAAELNRAAAGITAVARTFAQAGALVASQDQGHGQVAGQFASFAKSLLTGLNYLSAQCHALASAAERLLAQKHAARIQFRESLAFLEVMFGAAQVLAFFSFGASEAGFLAAVTGQGIGLRAMLLFVMRTVTEGMPFSAGDDRPRQQPHAGAGFAETLSTVTTWLENDPAGSLALSARAVAARAGVPTQGAFAQHVSPDGIISALSSGLGLAITGEASAQSSSKE